MNKFLPLLKNYGVAIVVTILALGLIILVVAIGEAYHVPALIVVIAMVWMYAWVMNKDFSSPNQEAQRVKKDDED